jgi:hypothetical protein
MISKSYIKCFKQVVKLSKPVKHDDSFNRPSNGVFRTCCQVVKNINSCDNKIILYYILVILIILIEVNIFDNLTTSSQPLKQWGY